MDPSLPEDDEERLSKKIKSHGNDDTVREITTISQPPASSTNPSICTGMHHTATQELPPEIRAFNFSKRVAWGKHHPYKNPSGDDLPFLPLTPVDAEPVFTEASPALCHHVNAISGRARACTMHLKPPPSPPIIGQEHQQPQYAARPVPTPIFMPVGTKGCLKGLTFQELTSDPALQCPIILANTYHLAIQPGTELIQEMNGLHSFQGLSNVLSATTYDDTEHSPSAAAPSPSSLPYNLLTDSGGFQMVSLVKLSQVTEEGVTFENPYQQQPPNDDNSNNNNNSNTRLLLRPEDSIRHQTNTGANIIMALDDVVSSVHDSPERFVTATHRTLRWYDRCYETHHHHNSTKNAETTRPNHQNLFPIVQGGLDTTLGGLREQCLVGFRHREVNLSYITPGYAIGGLAGGEGKDAFWKVVNQCCQALPDTKPRYLMGVGYPLDLVVCTALGVDMYDCVYPTRTARFGVALIPGKSPGTLRLKGHECASAVDAVIQSDCLCQACRCKISRSRLHTLFKTNNPVAVELITQHNLVYMMTLVRNMRQAILEDRYGDFCIHFLLEQFPSKYGVDGLNVPTWVLDALNAAGIQF